MRSLLDFRALSQTREMLVCRDGGLFPVLGVTANGEAIGIVRGGAGHLGLRGRLEIVRSSDRGRVWTPPSVVVDSDWDDRNAALGVTANGMVILAYHRQGCYDEQGNALWSTRANGAQPAIEVRVTRSTDGGLTWEPSRALTLDLLRTGSPYGKIVAQADGTLLMPVYLEDHAANSETRARVLYTDLVRYRYRIGRRPRPADRPSCPGGQEPLGAFGRSSAARSPGPSG